MIYMHPFDDVNRSSTMTYSHVNKTEFDVNLLLLMQNFHLPPCLFSPWFATWSIMITVQCDYFEIDYFVVLTSLILRLLINFDYSG